MLIDESIQNLVSIGEHPVSEKKGGGIAWVWGVGGQEGEKTGD